MINWNNERPILEEKISALGIGKAIYAAPDGDKNNARLLLAADGFHFVPSDFDDLVLPHIVLDTTNGSKYDLSFSDDGELLINGNKLVASTNQEDETISGNKTFSSPIVGSLTGNAGSATKLATAHTIGGVSFDGTANINLPGVNTVGNQSTTGNAGTATKLLTARTINGVSFDGTANISVNAANDASLVHKTGNETIGGTKSFSSAIKGSLSGNASTADKLHTARTIGGVSFDGGSNINLPGVNTQGNQNTTGNAASATKLQVARKVNGTAFDGTRDINVNAANDSNLVHQSGNETVAGNKTYAGDNFYMGTNTFMDGVSLNGKNVVNGLTDTDWLDIPLAEGRIGIAKYKVSLGKIFIHLDGVKGMSGVGSRDTASHIGNIPKGGSYFTRNTTGLNNALVTITCAPDGLLYISNTSGNPPTTSNALYTDFVVI